MPPVLRGVNFLKPVTKYSLMSAFVHVAGASFGSWIKERGIFMCSASE